MDTSPPPARGKEVIGNLADKFKGALWKGSTTHEAGGPSCTADEQQSIELNFEQKQEIPDVPLREDPEVIMQLYETPVESPSVIQADTVNGCDRTQVLVATYNVNVARPNWPARNMIPLERVSRPVRMRVRYTCHRCKTSFGHDKECNSCRHRRCARCDRYPSRKTRPNPDVQAPTFTPVTPVEEAVPAESGPLLAESFCTCHECQTVIEIEVEACPNCHHLICEKCHTEARLQSIDGPNVDLTPPIEEEERISQPEEQKLPPDCSTAEKKLSTVS